MDRLSLQGKVAIITGSSSGIGKATAVLMVKRGASIVLLGRDATKLEAAKAECLQAGAKEDGLLVLAGELAQEAFRKEIIDKTVAKFKRIDILVNNASASPLMPMEMVTEAQLDGCLTLIYKVPFFLTVLAAPHLKATKGSIVNVSSSHHPIPGLAASAGAKRALESLTECAALELTPQGVRVNTVRPGTIKTEMVKSHLNEAQLNLFGKMHLQNRCGEPYEVAEAIAFLASDAASFITGEALEVASGWRLHYNSGATMEDMMKLR